MTHPRPKAPPVDVPTVKLNFDYPGRITSLGRGIYRVVGKGGVYLVDYAGVLCECPHFRFRLWAKQPQNRRCKHWFWVEDWLAEEGDRPLPGREDHRDSNRTDP